MDAHSPRPPTSARKPAVRPASALRRPAGRPRTVRAPVWLDIGGPGIFLSGHFHRWDAAVAIGPDLDDLTVRMTIDATSPGPLRDPRSLGPDLFSFKSARAELLIPGLYRAHGQLTTSTGSGPFHLLVEVPDDTSAFVVISFVARREDLGFGWKELVTDVFPLGGIDVERSADPWMGVRDPELAMA